MNVLLVANYLPDAQYSMLAFAEALAAGLDGRVRFRVVRPEPRVGGRGRNKWLGYVDKYLLFRPVLRRAAREADLVHILDHSNAVYVPWLEGRRHIVTVHDLLPQRAVRGEIPGWEIGATGRRLQAWIAAGLRQAQSLVCVSEATRQDALRLLGVPPERLAVVPNGMYKPVARLSDERASQVLKGRADRPFLLHVGGNQPYKNRLGVVRTYLELLRLWGEGAPDLILAGHAPSERLRALAEQAGGKARFWIRATEEELQALYSRAEALLFLSLAEGFGLPVLEAMAVGCPVAASNRPPMTEVGGEVPLYVDPEDPASAAQAIAAWWPARRDRLEEGRRRAAEFTTDRMVEGYLRRYRETA